MQPQDWKPIVLRLVCHIRQAQDCLYRARDEMENRGLLAKGDSYIDSQISKAIDKIGKSLWDCRELPEGDAIVSATAVHGRMEHEAMNRGKTLAEAIHEAYERKEASNGQE